MASSCPGSLPHLWAPECWWLRPISVSPLPLCPAPLQIHPLLGFIQMPLWSVCQALPDLTALSLCLPGFEVLASASHYWPLETVDGIHELQDTTEGGWDGQAGLEHAR